MRPFGPLQAEPVTAVLLGIASDEYLTEGVPVNPSEIEFERDKK